MYCSNSYDHLRSYFAPLAALFWTIGAALILASGALDMQTGHELAQEPSVLNLGGSLAFLLATLLLFGGRSHKTVMTVMTIWFLSSAAVLISPDAARFSDVHLWRVIVVAVAAAWSLSATERDWIAQKHGGSDAQCGACYPQFFPFLILFAGNWLFIDQAFAGDNIWFKAASVLTGLGDLTFAFSRQIYKPKSA